MAYRRTTSSHRKIEKREVARKKIGRNEPCWCGSGKKYKFCHLDRENQTPIPVREHFEEIKQNFATKTCLAPSAWLGECKGKIVRAHTVPKSGSLRKIARNGHVYSFVPSLEYVEKNHGPGPTLWGVNKASTFFGFCSHHDNTIFSSLENQAFSGTPEQCFLLGYRALALELYKKCAADKTDSLQDADKGKPLIEQIKIQLMYQRYKMGIEEALKDLNHLKSISDKMLVKREFDKIRAYIIELENPPPVMGSGGFDPLQDFEGLKLQDIVNPSKFPDTLYFTSFYGGERGVVAFIWLPESDPSCCAFIKSLDAIPDKLITAALLRFFFQHCENLHINPDWWESLPTENSDALVKRFRTAITEQLPTGVLTNDGVTYQPWTITKRYKIPSNLEL